MVAVRIPGGTRSNITLAEPDGTITKINEPGPTLSADELDAITEAVLAATEAADWVAACGSLPPGVADDYYARLCAAAGLRRDPGGGRHERSGPARCRGRRSDGRQAQP